MTKLILTVDELERVLKEAYREAYLDGHARTHGFNNDVQAYRESQIPRYLLPKWTDEFKAE